MSVLSVCLFFEDIPRRRAVSLEGDCEAETETNGTLRLFSTRRQGPDPKPGAERSLVAKW